MNMLARLFPPPAKGRRDQRRRAVSMAILGTAVLGYAIYLMPGSGVEATPRKAEKRAALSELPPAAATSRAAPEAIPVEAPREEPEPRDPAAALASKLMKGAEAQIRAKKYDDAIRELHAAHDSLKAHPKAYLLMGRALEGKKDYETARDFYAAAIDRDVLMADAYFGFATASESLGDLEAAVGGMRNFLHVQPDADFNKLKIAQARSAIWEWESKLGRGAWGPTKGIPPGFTESELKRDGRGVGIKMPIPGSKNEDGSMKYEIKHQDKFQMFKP
jgi:tetratricopeptide (TPR) repeat protein